VSRVNVCRVQTTDAVAPNCTVSGVLGQCDDPGLVTLDRCVMTNWSVEFDVVDVDSGLNSVSSEPRETTSSSLVLDGFNVTTTSSVSGRYTSTCCHSNVTIIAVDVVGNIGQCFVDVGPTQTVRRLVRFSQTFCPHRKLVRVNKYVNKWTNK